MVRKDCKTCKWNDDDTIINQRCLSCPRTSLLRHWEVNDKYKERYTIEQLEKKSW